MPETLEHPYPNVNMNEVGQIIRNLHDQVAQKGRRVHITRDDCEDVCVMISRKELESLEQAIAILADTEQFNEMCENLRKLLKNAGVVYTPQGVEDSVRDSTFAD